MGAAELYSAFLNDPGDKTDLPEAIAPGSSAAYFEIPGLPADGLYAALTPGTVEFEASHLTVILTTAYDLWARYYGAGYEWEFGKVLPVIPRAGSALDAYYDRKELKFFYMAGPHNGPALYTSESSDVVSHECGHAILDAHHPDYWVSLHPESAAFHEAFGDITALLTTLQFPSVRARLFHETGGDLRRSSSVTRLAEQLGSAIYAANGKDLAGAAFLRDLVNSFRYIETYKLPGAAASSRLSSDSHSFSRIFSGAFYDVLVGIYEQKRQANPKLSPDDALVQARDESGKLLATALVLAPPGDAVFRVIAISLFKAERQLFGGDYFPLLRKVFSRRRILLVRDAQVFEPHTQTLGATTTTVKPGLLSMAGTTAQAMPPQELQRALQLHPEENVFARDVGQWKDEKVVQYRAERLIELRGKQFGAADGANVTLQGGLTLNVDDAGMVAFSGFYRAGTDDVHAIRDHVEKLAQKDSISDAAPGDTTDVMNLITLGQPYYIAYDLQGNKVIRRAYFACGHLHGMRVPPSL